jgi:hypothetical protein
MAFRVSTSTIFHIGDLRNADCRRRRPKIANGIHDYRSRDDGWRCHTSQRNIKSDGNFPLGKG